MSNLTLRKSVEPSRPNNLDDINAVRDTLGKVGKYAGVAPGFYERSKMDKPLEESIKSYQKEKGLTVDGKLNPKGETEKELNRDLVKNEKDATPQSSGNLYSHYKRLSAAKKDDGEKHRELSCRGAQKGAAGSLFTFAAGHVKEIVDLAKKFPNPEKYGGNESILADREKDLKNNKKGILHGYLNPKDDCEEWAKQKK